MCGGTPAVWPGGGWGRGLSPRVRGNPSPASFYKRQVRSIPACAGEPPAGTSAAPLAPVYPRVCGGTAAARVALSLAIGLSPRVRGNPMTSIRAQMELRSIPACAGEPACWVVSHLVGEVYPRVCGGTGPAPAPGRQAQGLSPRVRGNPSSVGLAMMCLRSIPACAGEPDWRTLYTSGKEVYPRVCGGTRPQQRRRDCLGGLSPRVRGNQNPTGAAPRFGRSIPACAGEPVGLCRIGRINRVYPRVCGGTYRGGLPLDLICGLSPRVRGNQPQVYAMQYGERSIPACAGEPRDRAGYLAVNAVYPRVCGGTLWPPSSVGLAMGLSPRVRGNLSGQVQD